LGHVLVVFNGAKLKAQAGFSKPVHVEDADQKKTKDDVVVIDIFPED